MLVLLFTSVTLSLTSALVLDNPLPLLLLPPASAANNNNNNNNNTPIPIPIPNAPHVSFICNGVAFGYGLDNDSCNQAIALVGISTTVLSFGMRSVGAYDIPLPQRFISTDGKCVVEPSLTPGAIEARACPEDIAVAALRVFVSKYDPDNVRCYGKMSPPDSRVSCQQILNTMSTSEEHTAFGPEGDPGVEVVLPFVLVSSDGKCKMTIRTTGKGAGNTDTWSWGQFWEVGVALAGMCVREGKAGVQTELGE
ncbi:MAG: hypothetical protein ASARMPREDX12_006852 [Alectoria sarmentosa]|nr:MAG: hypothetical protein ASARMPREDX12_006852 [Alectoria sarmentosa]